MATSATKRIEVQVSYDPDTPRVHGDARLLEHALLNIVMNGCQAMPNGGVLSVVVGAEGIEAHPREEFDCWVYCRVSDTGCGIPPEHHSKVFQPFFTTKAQGQGTGLGLAVVERVVKQHGGRIDFDSRVGYGTTFTIRLRPVLKLNTIEGHEERTEH